jgi:nucleoside-triphosphatase
VKHLLLTGKPGVGKTTLIEKLIVVLREKFPLIQMTGFITKEVRFQGSRIGFNIYTLDGQLGVLARVEPSRRGQKYRIEKYFVELEDLENIGIASLRKCADIIVLDEIGKMELFSQVFKDTCIILH